MRAESLDFVLSWTPSHNGESRLTTADMTVSIDEEVVWPVAGAPAVGLEIQADDLLAHLVEFWKPLLLRQTYPVPAMPDRPSSLRAEAERGWEGQPPDVAEREDERIEAFEEAHNLSRCFAGLFDLPALWFLRQGNRVLIDTGSVLRSVPFDAARRGLVEVGDTIVARLQESGDSRWDDLVAAWQRRDRGTPELLLAWSTGLALDITRQFIGDRTLSAPRDFDDAANDDDELRIAARMASALPPEQIRQIVLLVREFARVPAVGLDELSVHVGNHIELNLANHRAYEQGVGTADLVRENQDIERQKWVDIFSLVEVLGPKIRIETVEPPTLDGLAAWGRRHGPAILLNLASNRLGGRVGDVRKNPAARVTLAHELGHLLMDRGHALSAVDVLKSRMPRTTEQRARAFAGQLLLPAQIAAREWEVAGSPRTVSLLKRFLAKLGQKYGVPRIVARFKLEHGAAYDGEDLRSILEQAVPEP